MQFRTPQEKNSLGRDKQKTTAFTSDVVENSIVSITKCPLKDGDGKIWNCPLLKKMTADERVENTNLKLFLLFECRTSSESKLVEKNLWQRQLHEKNNQLLHGDKKTQSQGQIGESSTNTVFNRQRM